MICGTCGCYPIVEVLYNCDCQCHDQYGRLKPTEFIERFTLEDIKKFCLQYDREYPNWIAPRGLDIYNFICRKLDPSVQIYNHHDMNIWLEEMKNV